VSSRREVIRRLPAAIVRDWPISSPGGPAWAGIVPGNPALGGLLLLFHGSVVPLQLRRSSDFRRTKNRRDSGCYELNSHGQNEGAAVILGPLAVFSSVSTLKR
jgi:hypothetical protein